MPFTEMVPGMKPGSTVRNLFVTLVYLLFIPFWPFIAAYIVGRNRGSAADALSSIPGISAGGGVVAGVVTFGIVLIGITVIFGFFGGVGGGDTTNAGDAADVEKPSTDEGSSTSTDEEPSTSTESEPETQLSDEEHAKEVLRAGYENADEDYRDGIRETDTIAQIDSDGEFLLELRYNLYVDGIGSLEDDAEHRAGKVAVATLSELAASDVENVSKVAIYAYVPTKDSDDAVSTKIVIEMDTVNRIDWGDYVWQSLRDDAEQYKFNDYLYE